MIFKLLTEHHLEFLSLKGGCTDSSESTHVKISPSWKSHALAQFCFVYFEWPSYTGFTVCNKFATYYLPENGTTKRRDP